jgi:hypothetical protein
MKAGTKPGRRMEATKAKKKKMGGPKLKKNK